MEEIKQPNELLPIENVENQYPGGIELITEQPEQPRQYPSLKGVLKLKCSCGAVSTVSEEVIEDGLSWTMLIGNEHFLKLMCPECESNLTMFIEQIQDEDELPEESNKE